MATQDVPGANPANSDELHVGCWAEHVDGSLIFVKGVESNRIVYELYDLSQNPPVFYPDAMTVKGFKKQFSFPPVGTSKEKWTWHDKESFDWSRIMSVFKNPVPQAADVRDTLSAAERVAKALKLRGSEVRAQNIEHLTDEQVARPRSIMTRISAAIQELRR